MRCLTPQHPRDGTQFLHSTLPSMPTPPWMLLRLAVDTRRHHATADEDRLAMIDITTRAQYRSALIAIHGFESQVEAAIAAVPDLDPELLHGRMKATRLRHDLLALGLTNEVIAWLPVARPVGIRSPAQAIGWLFVLERFSLLSGLIRRHIRRTLGPTVGFAVNYLSAYGDAPGAPFRLLGEALCSQARQSSPAAIVAGAQEAFRAQRAWYLSRRVDHGVQSMRGAGSC